ncbi:dnaJ (Hsp40) homolog, subfamily C, member 30b [Spinachia spinachia]
MTSLFRMSRHEISRLVVGKMAEVGQRLAAGVHRLSTLTNSRNRPAVTGEGPGFILVNCAFCDSRSNDESLREQREVQPRTKETQCKTENLSRVRRSESKQNNGTLFCSTSLELNSSRWLKETPQAHPTAWYVSAGRHSLLQEKLLPGTMAPWTRGGVSIHPDAFRYPQQLRAFCTVVFNLVQRGSESQYCLKRHTDSLQASNRAYSWRRDSSSEQPPLLHRSRPSYYNTLKVSPGATQSQIKTAYYKQSFVYHPDKNPGDEEATRRFSEISEAYTVLGSISLRRKYDRGLLSRSDVQGAGRPSSKETAGRSAGPPQQHLYRARRFSQVGGKVMFDFDAFYQAHYGEQLQRERDMKARKQRMKEQQEESLKRWRKGKMMEMVAAMVVAMASLLIVNLSKS